MDTNAHEWIAGAAFPRRLFFLNPIRVPSCPFVVALHLRHYPATPSLAKNGVVLRIPRPMATVTHQQTLQIAMEHHRLGRLAEAETIYRQLLAIYPQNADLWNYLGVLAHQTGRSEEGHQLLQHSIHPLQRNDDDVRCAMDGRARRRARGRHAHGPGGVQPAHQRGPAWPGRAFVGGIRAHRRGTRHRSPAARSVARDTARPDESIPAARCPALCPQSGGRIPHHLGAVVRRAAQRLFAS